MTIDDEIDDDLDEFRNNPAYKEYFDAPQPRERNLWNVAKKPRETKVEKKTDRDVERWLKRQQKLRISFNSDVMPLAERIKSAIQYAIGREMDVPSMTEIGKRKQQNLQQLYDRIESAEEALFDINEKIDAYMVDAVNKMASAHRRYQEAHGQLNAFSQDMDKLEVILRKQDVYSPAAAEALKLYLIANKNKTRALRNSVRYVTERDDRKIEIIAVKQDKDSMLPVELDLAKLNGHMTVMKDLMGILFESYEVLSRSAAQLRNSEEELYKAGRVVDMYRDQIDQMGSIIRGKRPHAGSREASEIYDQVYG